jgi:putative phage-type endonuclease
MAEQGSLDWLLARMGYVTASRFKDVIGSHAVRTTYAQKLREEQAVLAQGRDQAVAWLEANSFDNSAMAHGRKMEPVARAFYELACDQEILEVGFWRLDGDLKIGASLDGVTADGAGTIEIKCPYNLAIHAKTCHEGMPAHHLAQVQGGLWVSGKEYCDFISFNEQHVSGPLYVQRIQRDEDYIAMLEKRVTAFAKLAPWDEDEEDNETGVTDEIPQLF